MDLKTPDLATEILAEKGVLDQVQDHLKIAGPVISAFVMRRIVVLTSVIAVGHLGAHYLASAGLASVTANVTGNSMVLGMSGALVTLCSQANGASNKLAMNHALQRALIILWLFICLPASILWLCSEPVMVALGQDESIAKSTKDYMVVLIPGLWALSASQCVTTWLYAQAKTKAVASITFSVAVLHPVWLYLFIVQFKVGFLGAAVALSLTKCLELLILLLYVNVWTDIMRTSEFAWSYECWRQWVPFLKLGLPNLLMMSEWWASEIIIFMSGALPDPEVQMGAMSIYQNLLALCFMLPAGVREACSTIVGNAVGAGKASVAKSSSFIAPALAFVGCAVLSALVLPLRYSIGRIFTDDEQVVRLVGSLAPIFAAYVISDGLQAALTGVIKGVGKQYIAGPIVVFSYYGVAIPVSTVLALDLNGRGLGMGVSGLCIGTLVGTIVHMLCFMVVVYGYTDMEVEVAKLKEKNLLKASTLVAESCDVSTSVTVPAGELSATTNPMNAAAPPGHKGGAGGATEKEEEEAWWDDLSFLGIETTLPGRTAVTRNNSLYATLSSAWCDTVRGIYSLGRSSSSRAPVAGSGNSNQQYASVKDSSRHGGSSIRGGSGGGGRKKGGTAAWSEYELVKAYTDPLSGPSAHGFEEEEDDYMDIDFDFI